MGSIWITVEIGDAEATRLLDALMKRTLRPEDPVERVARMVAARIKDRREQNRLPVRVAATPEGGVLERIAALFENLPATDSLSGLNMAARIGISSRAVIKVCRARPDLFEEEARGKHIRFRLRKS